MFSENWQISCMGITAEIHIQRNAFFCSVFVFVCEIGFDAIQAGIELTMAELLV